MKIILRITMLLAICPTEVIYASEMQEIVVTGSRLSDDYDVMPAVTIKRKADFLAQRIRLINDSRSPALRKTEIIQTIDNILKASKKISGIELSYGEKTI